MKSLSAPVRFAAKCARVIRRGLLPLALAASSAGGAQERAEASSPFLNKRPPEWATREWIGSAPLTLKALRGKAVVIRWWTGPGCPYCEKSVKALNVLGRKYRDRGLVVVGLYHHKAREMPLTREHVETQARRLGIEFPVAIDPEWRTLRRWWLTGAQHAWTSATFVLDREGIVRHVHAGGSFAPGDDTFAQIERAVLDALGES